MRTAHLKVQTEYMTKDQAARQFPLVGGRYSTENYTSLLHKEEEIVAKSMSRDMTV